MARATKIMSVPLNYTTWPRTLTVPLQNSVANKIIRPAKSFPAKPSSILSEPIFKRNKSIAGRRMSMASFGSDMQTPLN